MNEAIKNKYVMKGNDDFKPSVYTINDKVVDYKAFYTELNAKIRKYIDIRNPKFMKVHEDVNLEIWIELV